MYLVLMLYLLFSWDFVCCLVRFCVCYIVVLCRFSPLIFNAFPSVLVCYLDFVFCPWIYEFEQRYTTVAIIYSVLQRILYSLPEHCPFNSSYTLFIWRLRVLGSLNS